MTAGYGFNADDRSFTFKNGRKITIRQISYHLEAAIDARLREEYPLPPAPRQLVTLADGTAEEIENSADPDYQKEVYAWQTGHTNRLVERLHNLYLRRGVEFELDHDAVRLLRVDAEELGIELSDDDRYVFLFDLCIGSPEEEADLIRAIRGLSYPTEEKIAQAIAGFRG